MTFTVQNAPDAAFVPTRLISHARRFLAISLCCTFSISVFTQEQMPPTAADYGQWETLGRGSILSPNGQWLAYPITRSNGENELRVANTVTDARTVASFGEDAAFSADSRWLGYAIGQSDDAPAGLDASENPGSADLGLLDLNSLEVEVIKSVATFAFSENNAYLAVHRTPPLAKTEQDGGDTDSPVESIGSDLVVRDLNAKTDVQFANVSAFSWQDAGVLVAMTIAAEGQTGNGVQLFNPETGELHTLTSGNNLFTGLSWRSEEDDLVVLRSHSRTGYEGDTHDILTWHDLEANQTSALTYDPTTDANFPEDFRIVHERQPSWSDDGTAVFFGIRQWETSPDTNGESTKDTDGKDDEKPADVDVWHSQDRRIIPMQKIQMQRDRERNLLAVWHLNEPSVVQLGIDLMEEISILDGHTFAVAQDTTPYAFETMFGRRWMDIYVIDVKTGTRTKAVEKIRHFHGGSTTGRYLLYFKDNHFWTYELATAKHTNITGESAASFADAEFDYPTEERPPYGVAGWTIADESVLLYDRYDIWLVTPNGSSYERLTDGAGEAIRYRYVALEDTTAGISATDPFYVSVYGQWTKKSGYARINIEEGIRLERLLWLDSQVDQIIKADDASRYAYVVQRFNDSPDYFVSGPDLTAAKQVSNTNPFQKNYAWGHSELVDYRHPTGQRLQGALFYPPNYDPSKQYPMLVYVYELRSQMVHRYVAPSERRPYNTSVFTSQDYLVLQPDIVYWDRDPGVSATECVEAAVAAVLQMGIADPKRIGLVGHSWGGYETAFIPTQTNTFAAAVAGAPLTNFFSMFGTIHWNQGMPESSHFETGQARMDVPYWQDMEAYVRNSPVLFIEDLNTPMLVAFGNKDGTVDWHQGIELYNYARRAGKDLVMLVYDDENHSLRKKPNQIDYHHRVLDWFDHFLKGENAPTWITDGVSVLAREQQLQ